MDVKYRYRILKSNRDNSFIAQTRCTRWFSPWLNLDFYGSTDEDREGSFYQIEEAHRRIRRHKEETAPKAPEWEVVYRFPEPHENPMM